MLAEVQTMLQNPMVQNMMQQLAPWPNLAMEVGLGTNQFGFDDCLQDCRILHEFGRILFRIFQA